MSENNLKIFKELLEKYWDRVEGWATLPFETTSDKKMMEYENKILTIQNELIKMYDEK